MRPTSVPLLLAIAVVTGLGGHTLGLVLTTRGMIVPVPGYPAAGILLILAAVVWVLGLRVKRYLDESREREEHPIAAPRQHSIDMVEAYRIVVLARAASYTGSIAGGGACGLGAILLTRAGGTLLGAGLPVVSVAVAALILTIVGLVVQHWGKVPPPSDPREGAPDTAA